MLTELAIEQLSQTEAWTRLSPILREVLALHFRIGGDLVEAVQVTHPHFSRQRAEAVAEGLLEDVTVREILRLRSGEVTLSDAPLPGSLEALFLNPEWRALDPTKIKVRPDDRSDEGDIFDVQRVLRLYFTSAREDLRAAIEMYRPDLSQESVAVVAKALYETESVRRMFALRKGAI